MLLEVLYLFAGIVAARGARGSIVAARGSAIRAPLPFDPTFNTEINVDNNEFIASGGGIRGGFASSAAMLSDVNFRRLSEEDMAEEEFDDEEMDNEEMDNEEMDAEELDDEDFDDEDME